MLETITIFYVFAVIVSLLHLAISLFVTKNRMKNPGLSKDRNNKGHWPRVSILKPLKGLDDRLEENLRSFFELDYPDYELVFGLNNGADPAFGMVRTLMAQYPHIPAQIVVNNHEIGLNPKINNLYNMQTSANGKYILISDSNTRVTADFLRQMISDILPPQVGLVTATIRGTGAVQAAAVMENLHINSYISPNVFVADALSGIPVVIGKSILLSRTLLEKMGGFKTFKNYLAEDYLMGLRAKELGYKIITIPALVDNVNVNWSFKHFLNRHTRWAKIRRNMHVHHYLIEAFANPIALASILALLLHNGPGTEALCGVVFLKILHDRYVSGLVHSDLHWYHYLLVPVKDILISLLWLIPFFSYKVNWRENYFTIGRASHITPLVP